MVLSSGGVGLHTGSCLGFLDMICYVLLRLRASRLFSHGQLADPACLCEFYCISYCEFYCLLAYLEVLFLLSICGLSSDSFDRHGSL